ncbi:MAG TPA: inositol 2-dehydrogenase [Staphylococcus sp.]|uniref:Gfo/Idh/MocA family oxidoreductase n=1 Tax=Mammaliicoccus vitulinus TaxID=71237 RepID=UPI000EF0B895|nr:Gfo/Idh/MocA family oxidoreductase [Mammaliicoccus vitulinus]MBM6629594.1 Gfo/Idh/MocA family oxidoreductase [Mammaliicoccus vitulinus]QJF24310.1 Gfo/Idh/MocA family oxidoreductase [Mammaliicoccus vitulinus]WQK87645.1 Gfo/Idh/MocA family oxidoreductase [Mammaliicoccus vitulinus]HAL10673.1 inositol 2-dehydrogenase [Staphylococcus sp.]
MSKIKIGQVGLGRLGQVHAENIVNHVKGAELYAVASVVEKELDYARDALGVENCYTSYTEMIEDEALDAVVIVSPSGFHAVQITQALDKGLHVFSEKPIGLELENIKQVVEKIDHNQDKVFQLGFMRRFDESYQFAKEAVQNGDLGKITAMRCYGIDPSAGLDSFIQFAKNSASGGIFLDMSIHDIDLVRWFTGSEFKTVYSLGNNIAAPELSECEELETGACLAELEDGTIAYLLAGRNAQHGYHVETEIIGTEGMIRIGNAPEKNLVTVYDKNGVVRPTSGHFPERFKLAFINELNAFVESINKKEPSSITGIDGLKSTEVAIAMQESFESKKIITL